MSLNEKYLVFFCICLFGSPDMGIFEDNCKKQVNWILELSRISRDNCNLKSVRNFKIFIFQSLITEKKQIKKKR